MIKGKKNNKVLLSSFSGFYLTIINNLLNVNVDMWKYIFCLMTKQSNKKKM